MPTAAARSRVDAETPGPKTERTRWREAFRRVRRETERRAAPLSAEDQVIQSMPDASPAKWHRAHTTWFFETFLLQPNVPGYEIYDERFAFLFNSYYVAAGPRHARPKRGLITRPNVAEVGDYRAHVDAAIERLIGEADVAAWPEIRRILEIGLNHEEQHQELILTDILHAFAQNPTHPAYDANWQPPKSSPQTGYVDLPEGIHTIGHQTDGYCFDNEGPAHRVLVGPVRIARSLVTNGEWLEFIEDGGYASPSCGSPTAGPRCGRGLERARLLARDATATGTQFTLGGLKPVDPAAPVMPCQLLRGRRLRALGRQASADRGRVGGRGARRPPRRRLRHRVAMDAQRLFALSGLHGRAGRARRVQRQVHGQPDGAARLVARDADGHTRVTYRNFFYPPARWQFTGLRLADYADRALT